MEELGNVENLIPQRPPFVMVNKLLHADSINAKSSFVILEDNVLTVDGFFTEAGIIENIAQTSALHAGYMASKIGKETPTGVIGAIKNLSIQLLPEVNNTIITSVTIEHEVMNAKIVKGIVSINNEIIAECEMKVFLM